MEDGVSSPDHREFASVLYRALVVPIILLATILGTLTWATHHLTDSVQAVDRSDRMIGETEDVLRLATAMETGVRGYLLTGKSEYLQAYIAGEGEIETEFRDVEELVSDAETGRRVQAIGDALMQWRKSAKETVRLRQKGREFTSYDASGEDKHLMDEVRDGCRSLIAIQARLHDERVHRANMSTRIVGASCVLLLFALLLVITSMTIRQVRSLDRVFQETHVARMAAEEVAQRLQHAYRAGKMWSCLLNPETKKIRRSEDSLQGNNTAAEEDISDWFERLHPEDRERVRELMSAVLAGRQAYEAAFRERSEDGSYRWIYLRGSWVKQPGGASVISGVAMDFTEEKRKEESIRRMAHLLDLTYEPILVRDLDDRIVYWNGGARRVYGYTEEEAVGQPCHELLRTAFPRELSEIQAEFLANGHWEGELVHTTRSGETRVIASRWTLQRGEQGWPSAILETNFDITERKRAEQTLVRSEKLASVGRMAATIAHEINNPLAAAMNAVFLASVDASLSASGQRNLEVAERELERVAHIAKQTLGFYKETGKSSVLRLPELLDELLELYGPKLRNKSIRVDRKYNSRITVVGVEGEMRQVLSNLLSNSIDAMPDRGTLRVRIGGPFHLAGPREMLKLTIADTGIGVNAKDLKHIFEPFFTTKDTIGTGLGLWVTKELINKCEGRIKVRSRVGEGTVFVIWLPAERRHLESLGATA